MFSDRTNPEVQHELDVVDAVVRGGGEARPEDAALTDFALLVRDARPLPDHAAVAAIDARVQSARGGRGGRRSGRLLAAAAAACSLLLVVAVVASLSGGGSNVVPNGADMSAGPAEPETGARSAKIARQADSAAAQEEMPAPPMLPPEAPVAKSGPRQVARDARLTLAAEAGEIEDLADRVNAVTDASGGYVAQSTVRAGDGDKARADFTLMIPAARYQATLAQLSKLAHVRSRSQSTTDITNEFNAAERELERARARVDALEAKLATTEGDAARAAVRRELARARAAERSATARVRVNRSRVDFVPLEMKIVADSSAATAGKGAIGKAVTWAGRILTGAVAALIVALAVLLPVAAVGALTAAGYRRWRRRASDRAIGDAAAQPE